MEEYLEKLNDCLQHEPAFCAADCPFNLDVNTFISRLQEGRFNAAYKVYRDAVGFPEVAAALCTECCKTSCLRNVCADGNADRAGGGQPIELRRLEQATLAYTTCKDPTSYNIPAKNKSIAIIGAGISGMACALRMATKKYKVTVFEKSDRVGGSLVATGGQDANVASSLSQDALAADFELQMKHLDYDVKFNTEIESLDQVLKLGYEDNRAAAEAVAAKSAVASVMRSHTTNSDQTFSGTYDAIYIATGAGGNSFGLSAGSAAAGPDSADGIDLCRMVDGTAVFLGGSVTGCDKIQSLADGLRIATAIDNYALTGMLKYPGETSTEIQIDETRHISTQAVQPVDELYTRDEAIAEAGRCMQCQCNSCRLHCDLTEYVHKWPLRLKDEIIATTAPGKSELHATPAVRLINSCTHCGLCKDTCPEDIDMDGLIQAARSRMHKLERMPWAFNDFFLRDMAFTNGPEAYVCESGDYVFFPGCQLGASAPELVLKTYDYLRTLTDESGAKMKTGIMLGCCGIPALWAGDDELHESELARIREEWQNLGKPTMILACPTCMNSFAEHLPEIPTVSLYEHMAKHGVNGSSSIGDKAVSAYHVFDPCATRAGDPVRDAVRGICSNDLGLKLEPLPVQEKWTACCSYGGHGHIADPGFTKHVRENRIKEGELPFITYCINCRDAFLAEGKDAVHILDLIFGTKPHMDTLTKRRHNRIELKQSLTGEAGQVAAEDSSVRLLISPEVAAKLSAEYILEEEALNVVEFCERTQRTIYNEETGTLSGYRKIGHMTYWVEYRKSEGSEGFTHELVNAYTHRMEIELEMVWNGEKVNIDM